MKLIYVITLFLIFFNVFSFMFGMFLIFPYEYGTDTSDYNLTTEEDNRPAEAVFEDISGQGFGNILLIFFGDISSAGGILATLAIFGVAAVAAWLTHSPAPFVVAFVGNVMKNTYLNSVGIFEQFPINNYLMLAGMIGMIVLFIVTCAEYLTHGDV